MEFNLTFYTILASIAKLFILMFIGYIIYNRGLIDEKFTDMLSRLLVFILFPALIISKIINHFSFSEDHSWWFLPLAAIIFSVLSMTLGAVIYRVFLKGADIRKEFIASCGFQNCGYLPMNIVLFSFAGQVADRLLIDLFLFMVGFNLLIWSFVPFFFSGKAERKFNILHLFSPPVIATVFSMVWVALAGRGSMPAVIMDPISQLGQAAFPVAMLVLGAYLSKYRAHNVHYKLPIFACIIVKLFLIPLSVLIILTLVDMNIFLKFFLFLQSVMPVAVSLVFIGSYTGANNRFVSNNIFYTHLVAIFSIPLWLAVFHAVVK